VGAYTADLDGAGEGITLLTVASDGSLEDQGLAVATESPSYLTRSGDMIYGVGEGAPSVSAFRVVGDELRFHGTQDAAGTSPCAIAILGERSLLVAACYGDGTVDVHPLGPDGAILKTSQSLHGEGTGSHVDQNGPHAHDVLSVDASTVLTTDLGSDDVYVHAFDGELLTRTGRVKLPTGTGPRDLLLHPSGVIWVLGELSSEIFVLRRDDTDFSIVDRVALPGAEAGDHAAALALSSDGRFAYTGLRGSDLISVLAVSTNGETLTPVGSVGCGGEHPRHLVVDGDLLRVANQLSNSVVTFAIGDDGIPSRLSSLDIASPTYLLLD
jgi:6-phosphogluconolactonase (cycloisomerase 2 family)